MALQRLDKILASTGLWSRRESKQLVKQGRVRIEERTVRSSDEKVDPLTQSVSVDGVPIAYREFTWIMLNKPAGYLSATEDGRGETVLSLLVPEYRRQGLFPVGRLDKDTEGLLLLTNEGVLAHQLLAPRSHVDKVYYAKVDGVLNEEDVAAFSSGMELEDFRCLPAELRILSSQDVSEGLVRIQEGKFHQIKRMFARLGKPVLYLERRQMGGLALDPDLPRGAYRLLTERERNILREQG